jgi:hypothetical protein
MWMLFYPDGLLVFTLFLGSPLCIYLFNLYFPHVLRSDSRLVGISLGVMSYGCMLLLGYYLGALVCVLLLTLTDLTCSRRPDEFDHE